MTRPIVDGSAYRLGEGNVQVVLVVVSVVVVVFGFGQQQTEMHTNTMRGYPVNEGATHTHDTITTIAEHVRQKARAPLSPNQPMSSSTKSLQALASITGYYDSDSQLHRPALQASLYVFPAGYGITKLHPDRDHRCNALLIVLLRQLAQMRSSTLPRTSTELCCHYCSCSQGFQV